MTVPAIDSIGFCAHYSQQGDWTFSHALALAKKRSLQLNVFHFLNDPYFMEGNAPETPSGSELEQLARRLEKEMRFYYDTRAEDYLDVGFRLCLDNSWKELHRCLLTRQYQVLYLAHTGFDTHFCGKPIEDFANSFVCPVVLVGPHSRNQFRLNGPAALLADRLEIPRGSWGLIGRTESVT